MEKLLTSYETADLIGIASNTLSRWRSRGDGPPWIQVRGWIRYRARDVNLWLTGSPDETFEPETDELITSNQAADLIGISPVTLAKWRSKKIGPRWTRTDNGYWIRYRRSDVESWVTRL